MKQPAKLSLVILLLSPVFCNNGLFAQSGSTYQNPLPVAFGDPYVLHAKGKYFMYGTGGGARNGFAAYSSTDLVNWKNEGQV